MPQAKMKLKAGDVVQLHEDVRDFDREKDEPGHTKRFKSKVTEVTISKVGTKYAYVGEGYNQSKFDLVTGQGTAWHERSSVIHTEESLKAFLRRNEAIEAIKKHRRYPGGGNGGLVEIDLGRLTTEGIEALTEFLNGDIYL